MMRLCLALAILSAAEGSQVEVTVGARDRACFGISADDESVCSDGGGTCVSDPVDHCLCTGNHTGDECENHPCTSRNDPTSPPCYEYLMFGNLTRATMKDLIGGGLMLTVSIAGGDDWVDSEATKQAFIDGLTAGPLSRASVRWNVLKSTSISWKLVTISGSTLTLGPLMPAASFYSADQMRVSLTLDASMMTSGTLGVGSDDLFFFVDASTLCPGEDLAFDTDASSFPGAVVDTSFSAEGLGSAYFGSASTSYYYAAPRDMYTSLSYYIAVNETGSFPSIGIGQDGLKTCWWMILTTTRLIFYSDAFNPVSMRIELNRFYFVEHLIDYSTGMMTVRVDGEVKIENFASGSGTRCTNDGFDSVSFLRKGWLDELRLQVPCSVYTLAGSMTSPGGLDGGMLTVSIEGDSDVWVDTEATKQALIDGLFADMSTAGTGWNALKSTMVDTSLVSISGSKMTLGPLNLPPFFFEETSTVVSLRLKASMVSSGTLKRGSGGLIFVIPATLCLEDQVTTFDYDSGATFPGSKVDTSFKAEGRGSAYLTGSGPGGLIPFAPPQADNYTYVSYYVAMEDTNPRIRTIFYDFNHVVTQVCWSMQSNLSALQFSSGVVVDVSLEVNRFYFVEHLIDYSTGMMTVRVDGEVKIANLAMIERACYGGMSMSFERKGWLDSLRLRRCFANED